MSASSRGGGEDQGAQRDIDETANERTYLAWTRTALAIAVVAIAVEQFALETRRPPGPLTLALAVAAGAVLLYAAARYYRRRRQLEAGVFGADVLGPVLLTGLMLLFIANGAWIVLA